MKNKPAQRTGLLRLLSVLFALGVIAAGLGFGAKTYLNRTLDALTEESVLRNEALAEHPLRQAMSEEEIKDYVRKAVPVILRQDKTEIKALVREALEMMIRNSAEDFRAYYTRDEEKYRERIGRATEQVLANEEFTRGLQELTRKVKQQPALRRLLLAIALHSREITAAGAALAGLALLLWLILGGISAGVLRSGLLPALLVSAACAGAVLLLAATREPVHPGIDIGAFIAKYI